MQWNLVTNSSNPADYPEPGEQVLGLWLGGFWKKIIYSPDEGWYTARDGVEQAAPTWWCRVDTAVAKQMPPQGEVGPKGEEGPLGPDASVMERVRKFLERLIEVRDYYAQTPEVPLPEIGLYGCYDDWAADAAAQLLQMISLMPAPAQSPTWGEDGPKGKDGPLETFMCRLSDAPQGASTTPAQPSLALDVSLEQARALHRVWRALNDGDCPRCHRFHAATEIARNSAAIACPSCLFHVKRVEIAAIEQMFAPAMDAAVAIFHKWRAATRCDNCGRMRITKKTTEEHWPADFKPEGPDHVPDGFCNGICGAKGAIGTPGFIGL